MSDLMSNVYNYTMSLGVSYCHRRRRRQQLHIRLGHCTDLVSGHSQHVVQRSPSTLFARSTIPFDLRELYTPPFLSKSLLHRFLSAFNLSDDFSNHIFNNISAFANQLSAGNLDLNFHIVAYIDFVCVLCIDEYPTDPMLNMDDDSTPSSNDNGASVSAIERLMKQKFDGEFGETEQMCTICSDELMDESDEQELSRIPCGHLFHQSCIVRWLKIKNSCPLCRAKLQD